MLPARRKLKLLGTTMSVIFIFSYLVSIRHKQKTLFITLFLLPSGVRQSEMKPIYHVPKSVTFQVVTSGPPHQYSPPLPKAFHSDPR